MNEHFVFKNKVIVTDIFMKSWLLVSRFTEAASLV